MINTSPIYVEEPSLFSDAFEHVQTVSEYD